MERKTESLRDDILKEALEQYGSAPEYLWSKFPEDAILRHTGNRKWFAVFLRVEREKLGLCGEGTVDILDLKADPELVSMLAGTPGYLPAYHMNKEKWLTVLLDGTVEKGNILALLEASFELTGR